MVQPFLGNPDTLIPRHISKSFKNSMKSTFIYRPREQSVPKKLKHFHQYWRECVGVEPTDEVFSPVHWI